MDNVIHISNTQRGFTRMDNSIMDALAAVHLSPSEFKTLHAIARLVIGYNLQERRITAEEVAKRTNILPAHASRAISTLLARRILYRVGGSRGDIGICDPSEWIFQEPKKKVSTHQESVEITKIGSSDKVAKLPISSDSHLYRKESISTLPSEERDAPSAQLPEVAKPERKRAVRLPDDWSIPAEWVTWALTDRPEFTGRDVQRTAEIFADYWRAKSGKDATKLDWFATWRNWFRRERSPQANRPTSSTPDFHSGDTSWANDLGDL